MVPILLSTHFFNGGGGVPPITCIKILRTISIIVLYVHNYFENSVFN